MSGFQTVTITIFGLLPAAGGATTRKAATTAAVAGEWLRVSATCETAALRIFSCD